MGGSLSMSSSASNYSSSTYSSNAYVSQIMPTIKSRLILWAICLFVLTLITWSAYAEIDELVRGDGKVIPSKRLQIVQNLEGGILSELHVSEGSLVEKNQILLKIDDTQFEASFQENKYKILALQLREVRLRAEIEGVPEIEFSSGLEKEVPGLIKEQRLLFRDRRAQLEGRRDRRRPGCRAWHRSP